MGADARVLAILVVDDGTRTLTEALDSIVQQTVRPGALVVVRRGLADTALEPVVERAGPDLVIGTDRDETFGAAVARALDAWSKRTPRAPVPEYLLLLHDDAALDPDAVGELVRALDADPRTAAAGCKWWWWDDPQRLQHVGHRIDVLGGQDPRLEPGEVDHGQHDHGGDVLAVSTAGMLVRRPALEAAGGFDHRLARFGQDLDICWRLWICGHDVVMVPSAHGRHAAVVRRARRAGRRRRGDRYIRERNTLATLLANQGAARLAWVVPTALAVAVLRVLALVATRRVADAWQVLRAWGWNVLQLPGTLRRRRQLRGGRVRSDRELDRLFAPLGQRLGGQVQLAVDRVRGSDTRRPVDDRPTERRLLHGLSRHPVAVSAVVLATLGIVTAWPLLASGTLRGGAFAPWPEDGWSFLRSYASSWHDVGGFGTSVAPSPAQALLGILTLGTGGGTYLVPRLLVIGTLPLAWLGALAATRVVTDRPWPRIAAATVYTVAPPVLGAVTGGDLGVMVAAALLPAVAALTAGAASTPPARAWRSSAALALVTAAMVAFAPSTVVVPAGLWVAALLTVPVRGQRGQGWSRLVRASVVVLGVLMLLGPWGLRMIAGDVALTTGTGSAVQPYWRWLLHSPPGETPGGLLVGLGLALGAGSGILFAVRRRPVLVTVTALVWLSAVYAAWWSPTLPSAVPVDPAIAAVIAAGAAALLLAAGLAAAADQLHHHAFGWRQIATAALVVGLATAALGVLQGMLTDPWRSFVVGDPPLPAFVGADVEETGRFRVLVVVVRDGTLQWELTGHDGPSMVGFGVEEPPRLVAYVDATLRDVLAGTDPGAAARLGRANVRYVVIPPGAGDPVLDRALGEQVDLEPEPVADGAVWRVAGWLPRAAVVEAAELVRLDRRGELPETTAVHALERIGPGAYRGPAVTAGAVLLAEVADEGWEARVDGAPLGSVAEDVLARFDLDRSGTVTVEHDRSRRRLAAVVAQASVWLLASSLTLRAPGFARERGP